MLIQRMDWAQARRMTKRGPKPPPQSRRNTRRSLDELLQQARKNEARALTRFERKTAAVQKYAALKTRRDRKLDTRRKIIAGAIALEHMKYDGSFAAAFQELLDRFVEKGPERLLFGLAPRPPSPNP